VYVPFRSFASHQAISLVELTRERALVATLEEASAGDDLGLTGSLGDRGLARLEPGLLSRLPLAFHRLERGPTAPSPRSFIPVAIWVSSAAVADFFGGSAANEAAARSAPEAISSQTMVRVL
jgi:hypothetical protein